MDNPAHPYYTPNWRECISAVPRLTGCEAAYLFPMGVDVCLSDKTEGVTVRMGAQRNNVTSGRMELEEERGGGGEEGAAGNLVVHVRSGDIFVNPTHPAYGQVGTGFGTFLPLTSDHRFCCSI